MGDVVRFSGRPGIEANRLQQAHDLVADVEVSLRRPGETSHGPADPKLVHRLANLGCRDALSIHVYGVSFDRFGDGVNLVYAH